MANVILICIKRQTAEIFPSRFMGGGAHGWGRYFLFIENGRCQWKQINGQDISKLTAEISDTSENWVSKI